jgi:signal transduction histidine kinase
MVWLTEAALLRLKSKQSVTRDYLISARDLARSGLKDARSSMLSLGLTAGEGGSLLESLSQMAEQLSSGRVEALQIHSTGTPWKMLPMAENHVVRITQEALSNAIQHGGAHKIAIDLAYDADALRLAVSDDGIGFTPDPDVRVPGRGYGMENMRHRAQSLGGTLAVTSETGKGTRVSLCIPRLGRSARLWRRLRGIGIARIDG